MTDREHYTPSPASGAQVRKDGAKWTLMLVRELRDSPPKVTPIGRIVGPDAMKFGGWQRLNAEYAKQFGI